MNYSMKTTNVLKSNFFILLFFVVFVRSVIAQIDQQSTVKPSPRWANGKFFDKLRNFCIQTKLLKYYKRVECVLLTFTGALVCFGGVSKSGVSTNSMHSLNLYESWNTTDPAWSIMNTSIDQIQPVSFFAATYLSNTHNFLIDGGTSLYLEPAIKNQTLYYDTLKDNWVKPNIKGQMPVRRYIFSLLPL